MTWSTSEDCTVWIDRSVKSFKVNKWRWLWRQLLCVLGLSKRPQLIYGIDYGNGEDHCIEVFGRLGEDGHLEIYRIREHHE